MLLTATWLPRYQVLDVLNERDQGTIGLWVSAAALQGAHDEIFSLSHPLAVMSRSVIGQIASTVRDYLPDQATDERRLICRGLFGAVEATYEYIAHLLDTTADHNCPLLVLVAVRGLNAPATECTYILLQSGWRNGSWSSPWKPKQPPASVPEQTLIGVTVTKRKRDEPIHPDISSVLALLESVDSGGSPQMSINAAERKK